MHTYKYICIWDQRAYMMITDIAIKEGPHYCLTTTAKRTLCDNTQLFLILIFIYTKQQGVRLALTLQPR